MGTLCSALKNCLDRCFRNEEQQYKKRILQLEQRMLNRQSNHRQSKNNDIFSFRSSNHQRKSNIQSPHKYKELQTPAKDREFMELNREIRHSTTSVDSYFTIGSGSGSSHTVSRRTFKTITRKKSSIISNQLSNSIVNPYKQFKQLTNQNNFDTDLKLSRVQSQYNNLSQAMFQWNQNQYQRTSTHINFTITNTEQLKLQTNLLINQAVNKLQDYYTFYFNQINNQFIKSGKQEVKQLQHYSGHYFRKYPQFKCSYASQYDNINSTQTYMMLMTFQSNTSNAIQFLQWYNSTPVQSKLYNFQKHKIIQNGTYPIFQIQQFSQDIKQKYTYITVKQIQNVKFDNQPDMEYILQLNTTFRKGNSFTSLIRFSDSDNGMVQIYCQCMEKIRCPPESYFMKKWKNLENMIKERLVKISVSRVIK